jgi:hypothetical protein
VVEFSQVSNHMSTTTLKDAKEGLEALGLWMESRYSSCDIEAAIQTWDMPRKEKVFFTVYAMNLAMEGDGFECLARQDTKDVKVFIRLLNRLGARKTSAFVQTTLSTLKSMTPAEENKCTSRHYMLFKREKVWLKLFDYVGDRLYVRYFLRAQAIDAAGGSILNPKEWEGELPKITPAALKQLASG